METIEDIELAVNLQVQPDIFKSHPLHLLVLLFPVIRSWINISGAFWLYAGICILGFFYVRVRLPETKGKSIEEIEKLILPPVKIFR